MAGPNAAILSVRCSVKAVLAWSLARDTQNMARYAKNALPKFEIDVLLIQQRE